MTTGPSPLDLAVSRIGDRWTLLVVEALLDGPLRFGELSERVPGIAPNVLSARLRALEADGLVRATPYSERPVRLSYDLTGPGRDLAAALSLLAAWGSRHARSAGQEPQAHHLTCGTPVEARPWCPTCDRVVGVDETVGADDDVRL